MKIIATFMKQFVFQMIGLNFFKNFLFQLPPKLTKVLFIVVKSKLKLLTVLRNFGNLNCYFLHSKRFITLLELQPRWPIRISRILYL